MPPTLQELYANGELPQGPLSFEFALRHTSQKRADYEKGPPFIGHLEGLPRNTASFYLNALRRLTPAQVVQEYGLEALMWMHIQYDCEDEKDVAVRSAELHKYDINAPYLKAAANWAHHRQQYGDYSLAITQFQVMSALDRGTAELVDLPNIIKSAAVPNIEISDKRAHGYSLEFIAPEDQYTQEGWLSKDWYRREHKGAYYSIWLDAPAAVGLWYHDKPAAIMSLGAASEDVLMINQLQTINARKEPYKDAPIIRPRALRPIDWPKVLVDAAEEIAVMLGFKYIAIQSGDNNFWQAQKRHMTKKEARMRYDHQAKRLGYTKNKQDGNWYKCIAYHHPC